MNIENKKVDAAEIQRRNLAAHWFRALGPTRSFALSRGMIAIASPFYHLPLNFGFTNSGFELSVRRVIDKCHPKFDGLL